MAYSHVTFTGDGATALYTVPFPYITADDIQVSLDGVLQIKDTDYTFPTSTTIQFTPTPAVGATVHVRRVTEKGLRIVDFQDAAILTEAALDQDSDQLLYISQEAFDLADTALLTVDTNNTFNAVGRRISNVLDPVGQQDVATKEWVETTAGRVVLSGSDGASLVGFIQSGIGAVARTAQAKGREVVTPEDFGAVGDGVVDDTAALVAANANGVALRMDNTYLVSQLTLNVSVSGAGKLLRKAGSTGDFIITGSDNIEIDVEIDGNDIAGSSLVIQNNNVLIPRTCVIRNGYVNGVLLTVGNNVKIYAQVYDCRQTHVMATALTANNIGLDIDVIIDGTALTTAQMNGGIKVHGSATYAVIRPRIRGIVRLYESELMPANSVCIETLTNVPSPMIEGMAYGGAIGCTMNKSPNGVARVMARGQHNIGLEITNASHGAMFVGSVSEAGDSVAPSYNCQSSGSNNIKFEGRFSGATNARVSTSANFYLDSGVGAIISGTCSRTGGSQFVRLRGMSEVDLSGLKAEGLATTRAILLDTAVGSCDKLRIIGGRYTGITNFIQAVGTYDDIRISGGAVIGNSGLFIGGGPTLTNTSITSDCKLTTQPFGTGAKQIEVLNYSAVSASLIRCVRTGTPEGVITAAVGSVCARDDGGAVTSLYVKESGTSNTGWVAK